MPAYGWDSSAVATAVINILEKFRIKFQSFQAFIFFIYASYPCGEESNLIYGIESRQIYLRFHARPSQLMFGVYRKKELFLLHFGSLQHSLTSYLTICIGH